MTQSSKATGNNGSIPFVPRITPLPGHSPISTPGSTDTPTSNSHPADNQPLDIVPFDRASIPIKNEIEDDLDEKAVANAPFVNKVWRIVNDEANYKYIRWVSGGKSILIVDREGFEKHLLPLYFKHKRFTSFVRQLNMYGWHKVPDLSAGTMQSSEEHWQFANPNFIRGQPELLQNIVRNKGHKVNNATTDTSVRNRPIRQIGAAAGGNTGATDASTNTSHSNGSAHPEDTLSVDIKAVLRELEQIRSRQVTIGEDLSRIRKDNDMLWSEYAQMRERYDKHSQTLTKIFRFLATLYGNQSKIMDLSDSSKLIDPRTAADVDPMYYGLLPSGPNAAPAGEPPQFNSGIHELKEIEELQHQIDEASNSDSVSKKSSTSTRDSGSSVDSVRRGSQMLSLIPSRNSVSPTRQAPHFQNYNPFSNNTQQLVRASTPRFSQPHIPQYRQPQPQAQAQQPQQQPPQLQQYHLQPPHAQQHQIQPPHQPQQPHQHIQQHQALPQAQQQQLPSPQLRELTSTPSEPSPNAREMPHADPNPALDSSFFPDFGELGRAPDMPQDRDLQLEQVAREVQSQDSGIQSIEDWISKNLPSEDLSYNVDDYLADPGEDKGEEPNRKRARTSS